MSRQQTVGELNHSSRVSGDLPRDGPRRRREARVIGGDDDLADGLQQLASARAVGIQHGH